LLGISPIPWRAATVPHLFEPLRVWWCEHPGAAPAATMEGRFGHVDLVALRAEYEALANPRVDTVPEFVTRKEACPTCGRRDRWVRLADQPVDVPSGSGIVTAIRPVWRCQGCVTRQPWGDAGRQALA
jgi:hypothetical protein